MNKLRYTNYQYPLDNPHEHIFDIAPEKRRRRIDKDYPFERDGFFYRAVSGIIRGLALVFLPIWGWIWMHTKIRGKHHLRALKGQGMIIVANHVHVTDASVICAMASRVRKVRFITLAQNMDLRLAGAGLRALGGIPVAEDYGGMKKFNRTIFSLLERKKPVLVFPEVAMWPYYTGLRPFENGAFFFASKANVAVLPMVFTFKINKKGYKKSMVLNILPPVAPAPADKLKETVSAQMAVAMDEFYAAQKYAKFS